MTDGASYSKFKINAALPSPWGSRPCNDPQCGIAGLPWMDTIGSIPMLKSMTGYGRAEGATATYLYTLEVQAFNHRFTDIRIRLPRALASLEHGLHREIRERVHRGRFDVQVTEKLSGAMSRTLRIDRKAIQQYVGALRELQRELDLGGEVTIEALIGVRDLVTLEATEVDMAETGAVLRQLLDGALDEVESMRRKEGEHLGRSLEVCVSQIEAGLAVVEARVPEVVEAYRTRVQERVRALLGAPLSDPDRLAQEAVLLAERSDITEECTRLKSHIQQFRTILQGTGPHGRRLDFLLQEMHREVNTLGTKAADAVVSPVVVEMKADLERLREQVQNIE
ncbi:MAG: YicC/YloC family endoribonuclease [Candidatus Methylomirabilales bacterium]